MTHVHTLIYRLTNQTYRAGTRPAAEALMERLIGDQWATVAAGHYYSLASLVGKRRAELVYRLARVMTGQPIAPASTRYVWYARLDPARRAAMAAEGRQTARARAIQRVERRTKAAATRARRAAMAVHTTLPAFALRRIAAAMPRLRRGERVTLAQLRATLDAASVRPSRAATDALAGEREALRKARIAKRSARKGWGGKLTDPRRRLPRGTVATRLDAVRRAAVEQAARQVMLFGAALGDTVTIELGAAPDYRLSSHEEWRNYKGRSPVAYGRVKGTSHTIAVPADWRLSVERRGLALVAGAMTLAAEPVAAPDAIEAVSATVAVPGRGYSAAVERRTYARLAAGGPWLHVDAADLTPTTAAIGRCRNAERRRLMLAIYGLDRYLADIGARPVAEDDYGRLYRVERAGMEPIVAVAVRDATDPSREYVLRVAPRCATAHEAVAWTFGLDAAAYRPAVET